MDYGIVGNCQYNALIDKEGKVQWLCWPRFDSSFVLGGILDKSQGGAFAIEPWQGQSTAQQYVHNTNVLQTEYETSDGKFRVTDFAPRFAQYNRYYKPTTLIRKVEPISGEPIIKVVCDLKYDYGKKSLDVVAGSNHLKYLGAPQEIRLTTNASLSMVRENRPFSLDKTIYFALTYGEPIEADLEQTCEVFLAKTIEYWQRWIKHTHIPSLYQSSVVRSALVLKLHQYEDTGAIIAATTTSIPEAKDSVRNWDYRYCWLRDALFTIMALRRLNQFEELEGFVVFLRNIVWKLNKAEEILQPVYGISGEDTLTEVIMEHLDGFRGCKPVRVGNQAYEHKQHDVYGEMIQAISPLFLDIRFQKGKRPESFSLLEKLLDRVEAFMEKQDAGLWEFRGKEQLHCFTLLSHWLGASYAHQIGEAYGLTELTEQAKRLRDTAKRLMEELCFDQDLGVFVQSDGSKDMDASLLMLINLGYLDPHSPITEKQIKVIEDQLECGQGLIRRYSHADDFGETVNCFTICNFWLAEAYARAGMKEKAIELFETLHGAANHLGLYSEDIDPRNMEQWGNFPQAYSHVGLINAAFAISNMQRGSSQLWD